MKHFNRTCWLLVLLNVAVAQNTGVEPKFEAASLKAIGGARSGLGSLRGGPKTNSPGRLYGVATLKLLLMRAYGIKDYQIAGPGWLDSARYEIQATLPPGADEPQLRFMLQSLLKERFGLETHRETRQFAAYELMPTKVGPKLVPSTANTTGPVDAQIPTNPKFVKGADGLPELTPGTNVPRTYAVVLGGPDGILYKLWGRRETMTQLVDRLSAQVNRPVIDATGLKGEFDFTLTWAVESAGGIVPRTGPPPDEIETSGTPVLSAPALSIFGALQAQLGLRLREMKHSVEILVIDRVNATPVEN